MSRAEFFRGRLLKIVVPYLISVAVYFIYMYARGWVGFGGMPEYIFLGTLAAHFYYIIIAVQLYLLFPILKLIFDRYPMDLALIALASTVIFNQFIRFNYSDRFFGTYIFYFVLGMLFARYKPHLKWRAFRIVSVILALGVGATHITVFYLAELRQEWYIYAGIVNVIYYTLAISALISIFSLIANRLERVYKCASVLDSASYEIYLYHILIMLNIERGLTPLLGLSLKWQFVISFAILYGASIGYAILKYRLPKRKKTAK